MPPLAGSRTIRKFSWNWWSALFSGLLAAAVLLLCFNPNFRWAEYRGESPYGSDFLQDWIGARMIATGQASELYDLEAFKAWQHDRRQVGFDWDQSEYYPPVYPPPYFVLATPVQSVVYRWAVPLWLLGMLFAYAVAIYFAEKALQDPIDRPLDVEPPPTPIWFWPLMLLFPPMLTTLTMGQKGPLWLLIWAVTCFAWRSGKPLWAGLIFGLLSVKPTLFFLLPVVMLWHGKWRFVFGSASSFAAIWLLAAAILPSSVWLDYLSVASGASQYHRNAGYQLDWSCNLQALLGSVDGAMPLAARVGLFGLLCFYVASKVFTRQPLKLDNPLHLSRILLATTLLSPHFYHYDFVVLLLPVRTLWNAHRRLAILLLGGVWIGSLFSNWMATWFGIPLQPILAVVLLMAFSENAHKRNVWTPAPQSLQPL